jgi:hypothetical protein
MNTSCTREIGGQLFGLPADHRGDVFGYGAFGGEGPGRHPGFFLHA